MEAALPVKSPLKTSNPVMDCKFLWLYIDNFLWRLAVLALVFSLAIAFASSFSATVLAP